MNNTYLYGGTSATVTPAAGVKGILIRTFDGTVVFRVYRNREDFTDYDIRHDELSVAIDAEELASFYKVGERDILDHSPEVLGLKKIEGT